MLKLKETSIHFPFPKIARFISTLTLLAVASQALAIVKVDQPDDMPGVVDTGGCTLRNAVAAVNVHLPIGNCVDPTNAYQEIRILPSVQSIALKANLEISANTKIVGISDENGIRPSIFGPPASTTATGLPYMSPLVRVFNNLSAINRITVSIENVNFRDNLLPASPAAFDNLNYSDTLNCAKYNSSYDTRYCAGGLFRVEGNAHVSITDSTFLNGTMPEFTFWGQQHGRIIGAGGAISVTSRTHLPKAKLSLNRVTFYNNKIIHYSIYKYDGKGTATLLTSRDQGVGAALFLLNANLDAKEVTFNKNTSANYPAIFVDDENDKPITGIPTNDTTITMDRILVEGNTASYGSDGYRDNVVSGHMIGFRAAANHADFHAINLSNMVIRKNDGGGIFAAGFSNSKTSAAPIQIQKTAIVENNPDGWYRVAGLYLTDGSRVHMINSTIGENMGAAWSGAIRLDNSKLSLLNNTIVESSASVAISAFNTNSILYMVGNALHHTKVGGAVCSLLSSTLQYGLGNVESDNSCQLPSYNLVNTDPKLLPLARYWVPIGAPSQVWPTYAYKPNVQTNSPVLNYRSSCTVAIVNPFIPFATTVFDDQVGSSRQNVCDAGAFEYGTAQ